MKVSKEGATTWETNLGPRTIGKKFKSQFNGMYKYFESTMITFSAYFDELQLDFQPSTKTLKVYLFVNSNMVNSFNVVSHHKMDDNFFYKFDLFVENQEGDTSEGDTSDGTSDGTSDESSDGTSDESSDNEGGEFVTPPRSPQIMPDMSPITLESPTYSPHSPTYSPYSPDSSPPPTISLPPPIPRLPLVLNEEISEPDIIDLLSDDSSDDE